MKSITISGASTGVSSIILDDKAKAIGQIGKAGYNASKVVGAYAQDVGRREQQSNELSTRTRKAKDISDLKLWSIKSQRDWASVKSSNAVSADAEGNLQALDDLRQSKLNGIEVDLADLTPEQRIPYILQVETEYSAGFAQHEADTAKRYSTQAISNTDEAIDVALAQGDLGTAKQIDADATTLGVYSPNPDRVNAYGVRVDANQTINQIGATTTFDGLRTVAGDAKVGEYNQQQIDDMNITIGKQFKAIDSNYDSAEIEANKRIKANTLDDTFIINNIRPEQQPFYMNLRDIENNKIAEELRVEAQEDADKESDEYIEKYGERLKIGVIEVPYIYSEAEYMDLGLKIKAGESKSDFKKRADAKYPPMRYPNAQAFNANVRQRAEIFAKSGKFTREAYIDVVKRGDNKGEAKLGDTPLDGDSARRAMDQMLEHGLVINALSKEEYDNIKGMYVDKGIKSEAPIFGTAVDYSAITFPNASTDAQKPLKMLMFNYQDMGKNSSYKVDADTAETGSDYILKNYNNPLYKDEPKQLVVDALKDARGKKNKHLIGENLNMKLTSAPLYQPRSGEVQSNSLGLDLF